MKKQEKIAFIIILIVGFFTRFFNFSEIPFSNDELSALNRLNFSTYFEMIEKAVFTDGHPAGVQTFLWFYTKLFGTEQSIVKLPFVLMGFLSLPLYFFAARNLTNTKVALFTLAFLATLQYPIIYSQTIRPYSSGQFFTALCVLLWSIRLKQYQTFWHPNTFAFTTAIFLSFSNHYFNAFVVVLILPVGMILNRSKSIFYHIYPFLIASLCYVPQLKIFTHQLLVGSPGWLPTPNLDSLIKHLQFVFQFSIVPGLILLGFFIFNIVNRTIQANQYQRGLLWLAIYLTPILTAYFYSIYRAPLFQDSIFIFSFFFLFLFLGDILLTNKTNPNAFFIFLSAILVSNLYSLIYKREHYTQFYKHGYAQLVRDVQLLKDPKTHAHIFGFEPFFFNYNSNQIHYKGKLLHFHRDLFFSDSAKNKSLMNFTFRNFSDSQLMIATAFEIPAILIDKLEFHYPYSIRSLHFGSEVYLFSKSPSIFNKLSGYRTKANHSKSLNLILDHKNVPHQLKEIELTPIKSPKKNYSSSETYIENQSFNIENLQSMVGASTFSHSLLKISAKIQKPEGLNSDSLFTNNIKLICQVTDNQNETIYFMHNPFEISLNDSNRYEASLFLNFNHFNCPKKGKISCFIENSKNQTIQITSQIKLKLVEGNPYVYSLTNDF